MSGARVWIEDEFEIIRPEGEPPPPPDPRGTARAAEIILHWLDDEEPADPVWLVKHLMPEVGCGLISGQWGVGKTFAALDLSGAVMTGGTFAGSKVARQGGVLFVATEGAFEIRLRMRGLVAGRLGERGRLPFTWIDTCPVLTAKGALAELVTIARRAHDRLMAEHAVPLALVVVDTVGAAAGFKDENAAAEGQLVMNVLAGLGRAVGACVVGVDHFGKLAETGTRGTSSKETNADFIVALLGERDLSGNVTDRRLAIRKVRGAASGAELPFELRVVELGLDRDGEPVTTCVIDWRERAASSPKPAAKTWPKGLQIFRRAFDAALGEHGKPANPFGVDGPAVVAVDYEQVRAEFYRIYQADAPTEQDRAGARRAAFNRHAKDAQARNLIMTRDTGRGRRSRMASFVRCLTTAPPAPRWVRRTRGTAVCRVHLTLPQRPGRRRISRADGSGTGSRVPLPRGCAATDYLTK